MAGIMYGLTPESLLKSKNIIGTCIVLRRLSSRLIPVEVRQAKATTHELASTWYYDARAQYPTNFTASE